MSWDESPSSSLTASSSQRQLCLGQLASDADRFCPFAAVAKYPYRFFRQDRDAQKIVAERFWDGGQFKRHGWSIFYIRPLSDDSATPLLLIPRVEVQAFFKEIQAKTGYYLPFPAVTSTPGFDIGFQMEGEPRPRFLGHLTSDNDLPDLQSLIPVEGMAPEEPLALNDRSLPYFRSKWESMVLAGKNSSYAQKERKKRERAVQKGRWCAQLKRTQCYFGLRPRANANVEDFDKDPNATWEESCAGEKAYRLAAGMDLPPLILTKPAPYAFNLDVVFVCVDIEVYETDSKKVTEVGISTLDTADLVASPLGEGGIEWMNRIRSRHFRIADYAHLVNGRFVNGCPDKFRPEYGISEWISVNEVPQVVAACFRPPYSMPGHYTPHPTNLHECSRFGSNIQPLANTEDLPKRNIVLVGHEIRSDISYLRSVGYDVSNLGNVLEAVDTIDLWRAWKHEQQATKLSNVLFELEIIGWHLHNAGNDAAYTMQALIGITIAALDPAKVASAHASTQDLDEVSGEVRERRLVEKGEWADADEEGGDGGEAISISQSEFDQALSKGRKAEERAMQNEWNRSHRSRGSTAFRSSQSSIGKDVDEDTTEQGQNAAAKLAGYIPPHLRKQVKAVDTIEQRNKAFEKPVGYIPPHLRGLTKLAKSPPQTQQSEVPGPISEEMQKRLVIMDDEEYGKW